MAAKTIKDFTWRHGIRLAALLAGLAATATYAASRYTVGLDTQDTRCLDEWVYVIDTWDRPKAEEVARDDYLAVVLTADQTPRTAKWPLNQVMVKKALAAAPGDQIEVTNAGVFFRHGSEAWSHGAALAAARLIGASPEGFVRSFTLAPGQIFLMGDNPLSYDGRYYGPISETQIVGRVLWAF
jgi:conjugal transfer pilin signal peptidase TrbI